jgi:hypothetical protein
LVRYLSKTSSATDVSIPDEFVDRVNFLLPTQPWPQGIHTEVAEKLGVSPKIVSIVIRKLIDSGQRYEQVDGELFDSGGNAIAVE